MYKKLSDVQKEKGLSKKVLMRIAHSKDSPAVKTSEKGRWLFDMDRLEKYLIKHTIVMLLMLVLIPAFKTEAKTIAPEPILGLNKALTDFYEAGNQLYDEHDLQILSAVMQLENGSNSDMCLLLTGSVVLNRVASNDWFANSIEGVILQGYGTSYQQYATHTVKNLYTVEVTTRVRELALHLLLCGSVDTQIIFQSMYPSLGTVKYVIDGEYFAY